MHCWARYLLWAVILTLGVGNMITACGQKGALSVPPPPLQPSDDETPRKASE
jgi:predicted small lipoprotein YifL